MHDKITEELPQITLNGSPSQRPGSNPKHTEALFYLFVVSGCNWGALTHRII